ncbi:hypothetical protein PR048_004090 [Dryococelus australis]|uniref:Uncharacterized protein n=1 Tax=Dryococelus australis TaxID=614101 RepID=A0ABQ9I4Y6_9NEOP|nr:hypothetical protein PR048_004090 [Dryococelus australis]
MRRRKYRVGEAAEICHKAAKSAAEAGSPGGKLHMVLRGLGAWSLTPPRSGSGQGTRSSLAGGASWASGGPCSPASSQFGRGRGGKGAITCPWLLATAMMEWLDDRDPYISHKTSEFLTRQVEFALFTMPSGNKEQSNVPNKGSNPVTGRAKLRTQHDEDRALRLVAMAHLLREAFSSLSLPHFSALEAEHSSILFASRQGEPGPISGGVTPGFSHVEIVQDDVAGQRVFSGFSRLFRPCTTALLRTHLASSSSALQTSMLRPITTRHLGSIDFFPPYRVFQKVCSDFPHDISLITSSQTSPNCHSYATFIDVYLLGKWTAEKDGDALLLQAARHHRQGPGPSGYGGRGGCGGDSDAKESSTISADLLSMGWLGDYQPKGERWEAARIDLERYSCVKPAPSLNTSPEDARRFMRLHCSWRPAPIAQGQVGRPAVEGPWVRALAPPRTRVMGASPLSREWPQYIQFLPAPLWFLLRAPSEYSAEQRPACLATLHHTPLL